MAQKQLTLQDTITLRSGLKMPIFGLGTYMCTDDECKKVCLEALSLGYRLLDTATYYNNEAAVGAAIKESGIPREQIFVTTKLKPDDHGADKVPVAFKASIEKLGLEYIDLYLLHMPSGKKVIETWKAILELKAQGLIKAVGVSNFGVKQLIALKETGLEMPEINQFELHVWHHQQETVDYCRQNQIIVEGFCPLARGKKFGETGVKALAEKRNRSEADVCLRWAIQQGFVTIAKTSKLERLRTNLAAFDWSLSEEEIAEIKTYDEQFEASKAVQFMKLAWEDVC